MVCCEDGGVCWGYGESCAGLWSWWRGWWRVELDGWGAWRIWSIFGPIFFMFVQTSLISSRFLCIQSSQSPPLHHIIQIHNKNQIPRKTTQSQALSATTPSSSSSNLPKSIKSISNNSHRLHRHNTPSQPWTIWFKWRAGAAEWCFSQRVKISTKVIFQMYCDSMVLVRMGGWNEW